MSHPVPGRDYSDQTRGESDKSYSKRRKSAIGKTLKKLSSTQKATGRMLRTADTESVRRKGESPLSHLKRLTS